MFINLSIQDGPDAKEAKRAIAQLIEQVNQENNINPLVKLNDLHITTLGEIVEKFNSGKIKLAEMKEKLLDIFNEVAVGELA